MASLIGRGNTPAARIFKEAIDSTAR